jgi:hypothetical protein
VWVPREVQLAATLDRTQPTTYSVTALQSSFSCRLHCTHRAIRELMSAKLRIPAKPNVVSEGKPNDIPG